MPYAHPVGVVAAFDAAAQHDLDPALGVRGFGVQPARDVLHRGTPDVGVGMRKVQHGGRASEPLQVGLQRLGEPARGAERLEDAVAAGCGEIEHAEVRCARVDDAISDRTDAVVVDEGEDVGHADLRSGIVSSIAHTVRASGG